MTRRHSASLISRNGLLGRKRCVVQQRIDRAELLDRLVGDALAILGLADVAHDDQRLGAELLGLLGDALAGGAIARAVERRR